MSEREKNHERCRRKQARAEESEVGKEYEERGAGDEEEECDEGNGGRQKSKEEEKEEKKEEDDDEDDEGEGGDWATENFLVETDDEFRPVEECEVESFVDWAQDEAEEQGEEFDSEDDDQYEKYRKQYEEEKQCARETVASDEE